MEFPTGCSKDLLPAHKDYLKSRGFHPERVAKEYNIMGTGKEAYLGNADYSKRIIFPIYWEKEIVSWQSRDVTGQATLRYKACMTSYEKIHHQHIYFSHRDYDGGTTIICEGVLDAIKIGKKAIATFGTGGSRKQLRSIAKNFDRAFVLYDPEENAQRIARILVRELNFRGVKAKNIDMRDFSKASDPGEMAQNEIDMLIKQII